MGGGNLNLKKSWHTGTLRNIEKVWKAEQKAIEEEKKYEVWRKEKEMERHRLELAKLGQNGDVEIKPEKMGWMYSGTYTEAGAIDNEDYLLGRRRLEELIDKKEPLEPEISQKELNRRAREDPLFTVKKEEVHQALVKYDIIRIKGKSERSVLENMNHSLSEKTHKAPQEPNFRRKDVGKESHSKDREIHERIEEMKKWGSENEHERKKSIESINTYEKNRDGRRRGKYRAWCEDVLSPTSNYSTISKRIKSNRFYNRKSP